MNILFDLGHPAHVHLFRKAARTLVQRGHSVHVAIRNRAIVRELLDHYGIAFHAASTPRNGVLGLGIELLEHDWHVWNLARKLHVDVMAGTSVAVAHVSRLLRGTKSAVFSEDDARAVPIFAAITYPFADAVVVPSCIGDVRRANYVLHDSYHELAYLHPNHFTPDAGVLSRLGVSPGERYFIVRLVAMKAHHDAGESGIGSDVCGRLLALLENHGRVFVTTEDDLPRALERYRMPIDSASMHDALAFAGMLVTDSQTMTAEAAVLGVPAVRCNTFVGRLSYLTELEQRYRLAYGFTPDRTAEILDTVDELCQTEGLRDRWQQRRRHMLREKVDMHAWMVEYLEALGRAK